MASSRHQHTDVAALGLLSLATRAPVLAEPIDMAADMDLDDDPRGLLISSSASTASPSSYSTRTTHRRLASIASSGSSNKLAVSKPRRERRLSDARDAAARPTISMIGSPPGLSMAALSLSGAGSSSSSVNRTASPARGMALSKSAPAPPSLMLSTEKAKMTAGAKGSDKPNSKGVDYKCENCAKIYRHPSCLIKHRWEHTPHWRAASAHVCSKHQQVQLLEAAAILSHLSRDSALPEDRSLWPSFCGSLPPPSGLQDTSGGAVLPPAAQNAYMSSSVPGRIVPTANSASPFSRAPRMHEYGLDSRITMVRPGVLGVATGGPAPVPVAMTGSVPITIGGNAHTTPKPRSFSPSSYAQSIASPTHSSVGNGIGAWTLPSSSIRSVSVVSSSSDGLSRSSEDEDEDVPESSASGSGSDNVAVVDSSTRNIYNYTRYGAYEDNTYIDNDGKYGFASRARGVFKQENADFEMEMDGQMDAGADGHLRYFSPHHRKLDAYSLREEDEDDDVDVDSARETQRKMIAVPRLLNRSRTALVTNEEDGLEMDME